MRSFDIPRTKATHLRVEVLTNQCTGAPDFAGEQDDDPRAATDCATASPQAQTCGSPSSRRSPASPVRGARPCWWGRAPRRVRGQAARRDAARRRNPSSSPTCGRVAEVAPGRGDVEPVGRRELVGEEPGHRRVVGRGRAGARHPRRRRRRPPPTPQRHRARLGRQPGGARGCALAIVAHRPGVAGADEVRAAGARRARRQPRRAAQQVGARGVVDVGRVDDRVAAADEAQPAGAGAVEDARGELRCRPVPRPGAGAARPSRACPSAAASTSPLRDRLGARVVGGEAASA